MPLDFQGVPSYTESILSLAARRSHTQSKEVSVNVCVLWNSWSSICVCMVFNVEAGEVSLLTRRSEPTLTNGLGRVQSLHATVQAALW